MAVTYGFFDSINGDRTYNADDISNYFLKLISNGVFATPSTSMQVQAATGMNVNVAAGWGFINCKWINNDSDYTLQLDAADSSMKRIDRVVLHLDTSRTARSITIEVKTGTPAVTPTAPELTRSGNVYELSLAQIAVYSGTTQITQSDITDERPIVELCGWVTGLIDQLDTTELFAQFTASFNTWFSNIKTEVQATTIMTSYSGCYITSEPNEDRIEIPFNNFNSTLDILTVYINGLKLIPYTDFIIDGSDIVLARPLDVVGTTVEFVAFKSNDTKEAESIVTEVVVIENKVENIDNTMTVVEQNVTNIIENVTEINEDITNIENNITEVTEDITNIENNVTEIQGNITNITNNVLDGLKFLKLTQAEYDEIEEPDENTVYIIVPAVEVGE